MEYSASNATEFFNTHFFCTCYEWYYNCFDVMQVQSEATIVPDAESDPAAFCSKGKHQCILDEEIGIRCKFCSFVDLEIKHILPPLV